MVKKLDISDYKVLHDEKEGTATLSLYSNGVKFEIVADRIKMFEDPKYVSEINENFRNSLRYLKHFGKYPKDELPKMSALTSVWSTTDTGLAIRPSDDPLPEFVPFFA